MATSNTYLMFICDNPYWTYITPLSDNEEKSEIKEQLADFLKEGQYFDIYEETTTLTNGELVQRLMDYPETEYVFVNKEHTQDLIDHKENAIETYGEEAYNYNEYHDVVIEKFKSGNLFTIVPKEEAIKHLIATNNQ